MADEEKDTTLKRRTDLPSLEYVGQMASQLAEAAGETKTLNRTVEGERRQQREERRALLASIEREQVMRGFITRITFIVSAFNAVALLAVVIILVGVPFTDKDGLIGANNDRVTDINNERARNTKTACEQLNTRNQNAIDNLGLLPDRDRIAARALINAVAPYTPDCAAYTAERVKESKP